MVTGSVGDVFVRLGIDPTGLSSGFNQAERTLENMGNKLFYMGARLTSGLTFPLVAAGAAVTKWGLEFDKAMTESLAIMQDVTPQLRAQMEETAQTVAETTAFSAKEAAEAYYDLASAGLTATESMGSLETTLKFARAGQVDAATSAEYLAGSVMALGNASLGTTDKIAGMAKMADILVQANNFALGTVEDFAKALTTRSAQAMRMYNIEVEEGVAVLMAYAEQNIKGANAGQQFWMFTRDMQRAVAANNEEWKKLGITVYDSTGGLNNLATIISQLEHAFVGLNDEQRNAALASLGLQDRSKAATIALLGTSSEVRRFEAVLRSSGGAMDEVFRKQMTAVSTGLKKLGEEFRNIAIDLFKEFVPVINEYVIPALRSLIDKLRELSTWFKGLTTEQKAWVLGIAGAAAALGPLITFAGTLLLLLRALTAPFQGIMKLLGAMGAGKVVGDAVKAVTGLGTGMTKAGDASKYMIAGMSQAGKEASVSARMIAGMSQSATQLGTATKVTSTWMGLFGRVLSGMTKTLTGWIGLIITVIGVTKDLVGSWSRFFDLLNVMTGGILYELLSFFKDLWTLLVGLIKTIPAFMNVLKEAVLTVLGPLGWLLNKVIDINAEFNSDAPKGWLKPEYFDWAVQKLEDLALILKWIRGAATPGDVKTPDLPGTPAFIKGRGFQFTGPEAGTLLIDPLTGQIRPLRKSPWEGGETDEQKTAREKAEREAEQAAERFRELVEEMSGATRVREATELMNVLALLPPIGNLTAEAQEKVKDALGAALEVYKKMGVEAPAAMRDTYAAAMKLTDIPKMLKENAEFMRDELERIAEPKQFLQDMADARQDAFLDSLEAMTDIDDAWSEQFKTTRERQLDDANAWQAEMYKRIQPLAKNMPLLWKTMQLRIQQIYGSMILDTEQFARQTYEELRDSNTATIEELNQAWEKWYKEFFQKHHQAFMALDRTIDRMASALGQLARVARGNFKIVLDTMVEIIEVMQAISKATIDFWFWWQKFMDAKTTKDKTEAILAMSAALVQMAAAFMLITGQGSTIKRTIGGAIAGAQMGLAVGTKLGAKFGPYGALIGAGVGAAVGAARGKIDARETGQAAADKFREGFEEQLSLKQWTEVKDAMEVPNSVWAANRKGAATLVYLRDAYKSLGLPMERLEEDLYRLQRAESHGPEAVEKAQKNIQRNLDDLKRRNEHAALFVERLGGAYSYLADSGRLASKQLLELTQVAKEQGGAASVLAARTETNFGKATTGMLTFLENATDVSDATLSAFAGGITVMVNEMYGAGFKMKDIIETLKPLMDKLMTAMKKADLEGTSAFKRIEAMSDLMDDEIARKGIDAIMGLNDVLVALHNQGVMDKDTFDALTGSIADTFGGMVDDGYDADAILRLIAPSLQTIWEMQKDFGYETDASTQAMLDQAEAAGYIGEHMRDMTEQLRDIMQDLVDTLHEFIDTMRASRGETREFVKDINQIENPFAAYMKGWINIHQLQEWIRSHAIDSAYAQKLMDEAGYIATGEYARPRTEPLPGFAEGAFVTGPTVAMIGEGRSDEYVVPEPLLESELDTAIARAKAELGEGSGGGVNVYVTVNTISSAEFEQVIDNKMVPAILTAVRRNRRGAKTEFTKLTTRN